jgi:hypothetical protein
MLVSCWNGFFFDPSRGVEAMIPDEMTSQKKVRKNKAENKNTETSSFDAVCTSYSSDGAVCKGGGDGSQNEECVQEHDG